MNYTRKRALLACDFCRHRKRKCDGGRPRCSTCEESNADCVYKELPSDRVESSTPSAVVERLTRIEALLEEQTQRLDDIARGTQQASESSLSLHPSRTTLHPLNLSPHLAAASPISVSNRSQETVDDYQVEQTQFLIPYDHSASANSLLSWAGATSFVRDYSRDYFFNLEDRLPLPPLLELLYDPPGQDHFPRLEPVLLESLVQNYFRVVHPNYPLFGPEKFRDWHVYLYEHGSGDTVETAICLAVYALGCLVSPEGGCVDPDIQIRKDELALQLFQPALRITVRRAIWGFQPNMEICQALLLCSSFFAHIGRPLHSWKMATYASYKFIPLHDRLKGTGSRDHLDESYLRLFWSSFMIECDRAAEMDVPRSGIEPLADSMPLPRTMNLGENDDILYFVAETAIRRLLNRIHNSLYASDHIEVNLSAAGNAIENNISLPKLLTLSSELNRQLEEWYHSIPDEIQPPIGTAHVANDRAKVLRLRYYSASHIIHRPFVQYVALQWKAASTSCASGTVPPLPPIPQVVLDKCEVCITSCQAYLYNVGVMLDKRSPYLWTLSQSCMACLLVIFIAKSSPLLRPITPDLQPLAALVLPRLRRWGTPGSSFEAEVRIIESLINHGTTA